MNSPHKLRRLIMAKAKKLNPADPYDMGYDYVLRGANLTNCNFLLFATREKADAWDEGKRDAEKTKLLWGFKWVFKYADLRNEAGEVLGVIKFNGVFGVFGKEWDAWRKRENGSMTYLGAFKTIGAAKAAIEKAVKGKK